MKVMISVILPCWWKRKEKLLWQVLKVISNMHMLQLHICACWLLVWRWLYILQIWNVIGMNLSF